MTHAADAVTRLALDLLRRRSTPDGGGQRGVAETLADRLDAAGFDVSLLAYGDGQVNVVARHGDPDRPAVCLSGHLDTVSVVEEGWRADPWGELRDGRLYGRGSADMKGGVAALVLAAEQHVAQAPAGAPPVSVVLTAQEEVGSLGAAALVAAGALPPAEVLLIAEPTSNLPVVGHRGVVWLDLVATGRSCHGSTPQLGENAVDKLVDAMVRVRAWTAANPRGHELLGARTLNVGSVCGGVLRNVVPDRARAQLDIRTPEPADAQELPAALREVVGDLATVEEVLVLPPVWTDPAHTWVRRVEQAVRPYVPGPVTPGVARFFTDASVLTGALGGVPTIVCGPGSPDQAHVVDEYCEVAELGAAVEVYRTLLRAASG